MSSAVPLKDMGDEAVRAIDFARTRHVQLRLMGGLAVLRHCTSKPFCERPYSDIDMIGLSSQSAEIERTFKDLGYAPDREFNELHGAQRLRYRDNQNRRHVEVFLDKFRMDQTLDFRGRLDIDPYTVSLTDLFLTKIQIVKIEEKDFHDLFSLLRGHDVGSDDREGMINARYIARLCSHDWGLYHSALENLSRLPSLYDHCELDQTERSLMDRRIVTLRKKIMDEPKGPLWRARDRFGERLPYAEPVEREENED